VAARKVVAHDEGTGRARYEGSDDDKAKASVARHVDAYMPSDTALSATRRAHAARGPADDPKTTTSVARRSPTARAAVRVAEAKGSNVGARYEGSGNNEAEASAPWHAYASAVADTNKAAAVASRRTSLVARRASKSGDTNDGAFDKGCDDDEARASAPRAYASSSSDEALPIAARRGRAASAARRREKIVNGISDEGSNDNEANVGAARRKYGASAASDDDEAGATVKRLARAA
jgi:hypothetical protein